MDALKIAINQESTMSGLMFPIRILFIMGVIMMGIGIHFMERKQV